MRYDYSPEQLAWRDEVRVFVREHVSEALRAEMRQAGNEGDGPLYRPPVSNDYNWCVGSNSNIPYHCSVSRIIGEVGQ